MGGWLAGEAAYHLVFISSPEGRNCLTQYYYDNLNNKAPFGGDFICENNLVVGDQRILFIQMKRISFLLGRPRTPPPVGII